jgi:hypothetical protein
MQITSMSKVSELYGLPTSAKEHLDWIEIAKRQRCPYLDRKCLKTRKSSPEVSIGTCTVSYGRENENIIICPFRLLERRQIFTDCIHLLSLHEPGNELHIIPELTVPGGSIDYCLTSVRDGQAVDFVGIELQTLDTTGTVWPERQRFLMEHGLRVRRKDIESAKPFGMNWKMTAKTILVQLHHKVETLEAINKHLVLVAQDGLINYMQKAFSFGHLKAARAGDPMHFHSYGLVQQEGALRLRLTGRLSTDSQGIATCLGLQASASLEVEHILAHLTTKLSSLTLMTVSGPPPPTTSLAIDAEEE